MSIDSMKHRETSIISICQKDFSEELLSPPSNNQGLTYRSLRAHFEGLQLIETNRTQAPLRIWDRLISWVFLLGTANYSAITHVKTEHVRTMYDDADPITG